MGYPSDLNKKEWFLIKDYFDCGRYGNRRKHTVKSLVNAVLYLTKTGCQWRQLPNDFPPWSTVHSFYYRAKQRGIWEKVLRRLVTLSRQGMEKSASPSYAIIDSQSVKTTSSAQSRGIDGGKKNKRAKATHRN